jgi:DNA ligase-1
MSSFTDTLYYKAKKGAMQSWRTWVEGDVVFTEYGQVGGQMQCSSKRCKATNEGRSNERTPHEQALFEAEALFTNKLERKYSLTKEEAENPVMLPMLAKSYTPGMDLPAYWHMQPKFDGVRCIASNKNGVITLMSRSGKPYDVAHIVDELSTFMKPGDIFDGELYCHGESCQTITSWVKKAKEESSKLCYHIYDYPSVEAEFMGRWSKFLNKFPRNTAIPHIAYVPTVQVGERREIAELHDLWVREGYEGAIIRLPGSEYEWGHRSSNLLKVKDFKDDEFIVIGCNEGRGKMEGCAIFTCITGPGKTFEVNMACPIEMKKKYLIDSKKYIGRKLTVRYQNLTDDGIPRFPVGKLFREDKDIS